MPRLAWTVILLVLPYLAGMTGTQYHIHPLVEMGSQELCAPGGLEQ
jgi:hypothetical protein